MAYTIWVDTETTGIEADTNLLLEFAIVITRNDTMEIVDESSHIISYPISAVRDACNDYVLQMHEKNGLLADIDNPDVFKVSLAQLDVALVNLLLEYGIESKGVLAGNSIHFDRTYIDRYLPQFAKRLSYRMLDVSVFNLAQRLGYGFEVLGEPAKQYEHRALDDIKESINEFKRYGETLQRLCAAAEGLAAAE